jgi:hypothetical protein
MDEFKVAKAAGRLDKALREVIEVGVESYAWILDRSLGPITEERLTPLRLNCIIRLRRIFRQENETQDGLRKSPLSAWQPFQKEKRCGYVAQGENIKASTKRDVLTMCLNEGCKNVGKTICTACQWANYCRLSCSACCFRCCCSRKGPFKLRGQEFFRRLIFFFAQKIPPNPLHFLSCEFFQTPCLT